MTKNIWICPHFQCSVNRLWGNNKRIALVFAALTFLILRFILNTWPAVSQSEATVKMYWTDDQTGKIQRANLDGSSVEDLISSGLTNPEGLALDLSANKMYWTDYGTNKIQRANLDGTNVEDLVAEGLLDPQAIALDISGGKMYWTDNGTDKVQRANLDGSNIEDLVTSGLVNSEGIALDVVRGKMYWTDWGADRIQRANLDGSAVEDVVTTNIQQPRGIAVDSESGHIYWSDSDTFTVRRANLDGSDIVDVISTGLHLPEGIALDKATEKIYWTDVHKHHIQRANLDGSNIETLLASGLDAPSYIALDLRIPTPTPTDIPLPDLEITRLWPTLEEEGCCRCYVGTLILGYEVIVVNNGNAAAGAFSVQLSDVQQQIDSGLAAGSSVRLWFETLSNGNPVAVVDPADLVVESNEGNNTFILTTPPTLTPPPTCTPTPNITPTFTPTPNITPTITPTPTDTPTDSPDTPTGEVSPSGPSTILLPYLAIIPASTSLPEPTWQKLGSGPQTVDSLAINGSTLFVTDRSATNKGLFQRDISSCASNSAFSQNPSISSGAFGIEFNGPSGLTAAFRDGLYYSLDSGSIWTLATGIPGEVYSVAFAGSTGYAGVAQSVYQSNDSGVTWQSMAALNSPVNVIRRISSSLWLGTDGGGVQELTLGNNAVIPQIDGLTSEASRQVWDIYIADIDTLYIATYDGVFRGSGFDTWQRVGDNLDSSETRALEIIGDNLYVGTRGSGVYQISLANPTTWTQVTTGHSASASWTVRDLLYDDVHCGGLLAGTDDGVWVLR